MENKSGIAKSPRHVIQAVARAVPPLRCGCRLLRRLAVAGFVRPAAKLVAASGPALVLAPIAAVRAAPRPPARAV